MLVDISLFSDEESLVLDMCAKHEMMFNRTLHLLFKNYSQNLKNCECWVNKAPFSPVIMELRLNSRYKDKCSASRLLINEHHYMCDSKSDSYGAIFGEALYDDLPLGAFISLVHNSDMEPPGMVWIALIPDGKNQVITFKTKARCAIAFPEHEELADENRLVTEYDKLFR